MKRRLFQQTEILQQVTYVSRPNVTRHIHGYGNTYIKCTLTHPITLTIGIQLWLAKKNMIREILVGNSSDNWWYRREDEVVQEQVEVLNCNRPRPAIEKLVPEDDEYEQLQAKHG